MFPSSPPRDPFYRDVDPPPSRTDRFVEKGYAAYAAAGAVAPSLGMVIGPIPTALMLHPQYRAELMAPPPNARRPMSELARRNTLEGMMLISSFAAFFWLVAVAYSVYLLLHPSVRTVGRWSLAACGLILLAALLRYAAYALSHR